ncbi:MAG: lysophospholipid acyltransferase family protein, partial [Candidatus Omnitrophica bacterium]|nr:lysophospholipid acyltransferase family protein [Candidatus Omnitrophota bacterium]
FSALRGNEFLALLGDRDFSRHGIYPDFFGKKALIPKGPAVFSHRCGATIVPTFMIREPDDTFTLFFDTPIVPDPAEPEAKAVEHITKECVAVIEKYVRRYPDQWYIFKPFWDNGAKKKR